MASEWCVKVSRLAGAQLPDDVRHEHLARLSTVADAGGELDGGAEEVIVLGDGFACVKADADAYLTACQVALNLERGFDGADGGGEGGHDAVAGVFHLATAVVFERLADGVVVAVEDFLSGLVSNALSKGRRGFEVGEHDGFGRSWRRSR